MGHLAGQSQTRRDARRHAQRNQRRRIRLGREPPSSDHRSGGDSTRRARTAGIRARRPGLHPRTLAEPGKCGGTPAKRTPRAWRRARLGVRYRANVRTRSARQATVRRRPAGAADRSATRLHVRAQPARGGPRRADRRLPHHRAIARCRGQKNRGRRTGARREVA